MDDLTAFISARLDEDEATHRYAGEGRIAWLTYRLGNGDLSHTTVAADHHDDYWCADGKLLPEPASVRVVYDQARVLREVAAMRQVVLALHATGRPTTMSEQPSPTAGLARLALRHLAAVWSDHPDYKPGWTM